MIIAGFLGADTSPVTPTTTAVVAPTIAPPVAASVATRTPFQRPVQATSRYMPRSLDTGFIPEFEPFPSVMLPQMPRSIRLPSGVRNPLASEPGSGGVPTSADPSGQSTIPAGTPSPVRLRSGRMLPPNLVMALGIMPSVRGVRSGRVNPSALIASGRKPGSL